MKPQPLIVTFACKWVPGDVDKLERTLWKCATCPAIMLTPFQPNKCLHPEVVQPTLRKALGDASRKDQRAAVVDNRATPHKIPAALADAREADLTRRKTMAKAVMAKIMERHTKKDI